MEAWLIGHILEHQAVFRSKLAELQCLVELSCFFSTAISGRVWLATSHCSDPVTDLSSVSSAVVSGGPWEILPFCTLPFSVFMMSFVCVTWRCSLLSLVFFKVSSLPLNSRGCSKASCFCDSHVKRSGLSVWFSYFKSICRSAGSRRRRRCKLREVNPASIWVKKSRWPKLCWR